MTTTIISRFIAAALLLLSGFLFNASALASAHDTDTDDFITVWRMPANDLELTFPGEGTYTINWGDDTPEQDIVANSLDERPSHTYEDPGDYIVTASNTITVFRVLFQGTNPANVTDGEDRFKLRSVSQWGTANWDSMQSAFRGAFNMRMNASDTPDLSGVNNMSTMFLETNFNGNNISGWNVSTVTNMSDMFGNSSNFNGNIGGWNVSSVTNMYNMFNDSPNFNGNIGGWNVSSVTNMRTMFSYSFAFNGDIRLWDVSSVTNMEGMFFNASGFNQNIGGWNVSSVTNMRDMFTGTTYSQNLGRWYAVANVGFSITLAAQNTFLTTEQMPTYTLLAGAGDNDSFTLDTDGSTLIPNADTPLGATYELHITIGGPLVSFGINNVAILSINHVNTSFISKWRIPEGGGSDAERTLNFPGNNSRDNNAIYEINWGDESPVEQITGEAMHKYARAGEYIISASRNITQFSLNNGEDKEKLIELIQWGTADWSSMEGAFYGGSEMIMNASDAPNLASVSSMQNMFRGASLFNSDISSWDVSSVSNMNSMFQAATAFNQTIGDWDVSSVTSMENMFDSATGFNQSLNNWNVSIVSNMNSMFQAATAFNQTIGDWDVSSVTSMENMFDSATAFSQNLGRWYVSDRAASPSPTLSAQNNELRRQNPSYTLLAGDGDSHNNLFTLNPSTSVLSPSDPNQATGTYSLRIGSGGATTFGRDNATIIALTSTDAPDGTRLYAIDVLRVAGAGPAPEAVAITVSTSSVTAVAGIAITPVTISSTGGAVAGYAITPEIANGLSFNPSTGTISGTPTAAAADTVTYTITARNSTSTATVTVAISVPNTYAAASTVEATSATNAEGLTVITLGQSPAGDIQATSATITLPSGQRNAMITVATLADDSQALPAARPVGTVANSRRSLVDIDVTGVSSGKSVTICLPHGGIRRPGLYHAATRNAWNLLPSQQVTASLVCGDAIVFSPFAVFENIPSLDAAGETQVLNAILPQLLRAATKMTVDNISQRIDQALDVSGSSHARLNIGSSSNLQQLLDNNIRTLLYSELNVKQMLNNSSFLIPLNIAGANNKGLSNMTLWGSGNYLSLADEVGDDGAVVAWEGEVIGASVGIDARLKPHLVAGAAFAYSAGDVSYTRDGAYSDNNTLSNTLFSVHPYIAYNLSQGRVWGTLGFGQGELAINEQAVSTTETSKRDTKLSSFALGAKRHLSSSANWLGISGTTNLGLKGEVSLSTIKVGKSTLNSTAPSLSIAAHRYRMALEASQQHPLAGGGSTSPSIELGIRYDAGSGEETGGSIELAGSYRYRGPKGLDMELRAHTLLLHQSDYQEWGLSGLVKYQATRSGQGLRLSLQPAWGATPGNVAARIWQASAVSSYANDADSSNKKLQLNSELGYGLPGPYGHGLLTPYAGLGIANTQQSYNIGARWTIDPKSKLNLIGEHKQAGDSIQLRGDFSF